MSRTGRIGILATSNGVFWITMFGLTWYRQIPEVLTWPSSMLSQLFAWPLGLCCFSTWFLINAELHETGWRLALTTTIMLANTAVWAWCVDWLWCTLIPQRTRREARGFPLGAAKQTDLNEQ